MAFDVDRIHKPVKRLRKFLRKSPKRPTTEQIHNLRTSARRFEANLEALDLSSRANEQQLLPDLEAIRKRAGKIRDMDVLTGYVLNVKVDGEQDCLVQLIEILGERRAKHVAKLQKLIGETGSQLRRRLKRTSRKLEKLVERAGQIQANSKPQPSEEAAAKALAMSGALKGPAHLDKRNLHPYRLKVKELRYILQLSDRADQEQFVEKLGEVKDAIGEWHDWEELIAIATDVLDHGAQCKLISNFKNISEQKYNEALALALHLRSDYLETKTSKSPKRKPGPSKPVLVAASTLSA